MTAEKKRGLFVIGRALMIVVALAPTPLDAQERGGRLFSLESERQGRVLENQAEEERRHVKIRIRPRTYLGVQVLELTAELRAHFGIPGDAGVLVAKVASRSPAQDAGVQVGDIVTAIDGNAVSRIGGLARSIAGREEGDSVRLELWRGGSRHHVDVMVARRDEGFIASPGGFDVLRTKDGGAFRFIWKGMPQEIGDIDDPVREALEKATEHMHELAESGEWQERLKQVESTDWDFVNLRMRLLEERLKVLEQELVKEESKKRP